MAQMNNGGRPDHPQRSEYGGDLSDEALRALLREHGKPAPYDSIDWTGLAQRIVASGREEFAARQQSGIAVVSPATGQPSRWSESSRAARRASAGASGGASAAAAAARRPVGGRWWEVTAGWARPTIAAAVVVSAVSAALALASPATAAQESGDAASAAWVQNLAGGSSTTLADRPAGIVLDPALGAASRDSLLTAVVEQCPRRGGAGCQVAHLCQPRPPVPREPWRCWSS